MKKVDPLGRNGDSLKGNTISSKGDNLLPFLHLHIFQPLLNPFNSFTPLKRT